MQLDHYRPTLPAASTPRPVGRYIALGAGALVAVTWSMAVLTILVVALAIGAMSVAFLASVLKGLIGSQKR
uniref:SpdD protein n=1 Tax=Streptomyces sp. X335 TaxID=1187849 RepID=UPI0015658617|nr:SpdD protein [Streptomyces sp. X335]